MIDLRYHIYSLAAVFLALALGIAIGICVVAPGKGDGKEIARRQAQIHRLEQRFDTLRNEIARKQTAISDVQSKLEQTEQVCKALLPSAIKGRLAYRNVAIIQTSGSDEAVAIARTALEQAGADVTTLVRARDSLAPDSEELVKAASGLTATSASGDTDKMKTVLSVIAEAVVWARGADKLESLHSAGLITASGTMNHWNRLVVIVSGADNEEQNRTAYLDAPLAALLRDEGATVVGCETTGCKVSCAAAFAGKGISTVDNIDKAAGQMGLIYALSGERGHYGVKDSADRLIPRTLGQVYN